MILSRVITFSLKNVDFKKGNIMNNRIRRQVQSTQRKRQLQRQKHKINTRRLGQFLIENNEKT